MVALVASSIAAGFAEAAVLALVAYIAAALSTGAHTVELQLTGIGVGAVAIPVLLGVGIALVLVRLALQEVGAYLPSRVGANLQVSLREELWAAFLAASWSTQAEERDGGLQEVLSVQVARATDAVLYAASGLAAGFTFAALVVSSLLLNVGVAALTILAAGVLFLGLRPLTAVSRRFSQQLAQDSVEYAAGVGEGVRMAQEIRVFDAADAQHAHTNELLGRVRHSYFRGQVMTRNIIPLYQSAALLIILGGLAGLYATGTEHVAALGAVVLVLIRALNYSQTGQAAYHQLNESLPYVDAVKAARDRYVDRREPDGDLPLPSLGGIEVTRTSRSRYLPGREVLRDVSFSVDAGASVGIVGPSGAGKSTLLDLLLRLRAAQEGAVLVGGSSVEGFSRSDWARRVAYVPQDCRLLTAIRARQHRVLPAVDRPASRGARRARRAHPRRDRGVARGVRHADRSARRRGLGWATATNLPCEGARRSAPMSSCSTSPRARSICSPSRSSSDRWPRSAVTSRCSIVAHRLSTLSVCDRILVLADGRLEASGTAEELVADNEFFREPWPCPKPGRPRSDLEDEAGRRATPDRLGHSASSPSRRHTRGIRGDGARVRPLATLFDEVVHVAPLSEGRPLRTNGRTGRRA